jgi:hypothetical protein
LRPGVGEAAAEDARHRHAAPAAFLERLLHVLDQDVRVVDRFRDIRDAGIGLLAEDLLARRIDREDLSGVAMLSEIALRTRSALCGVARSSDERD